MGRSRTPPPSADELKAMEEAKSNITMSCHPEAYHAEKRARQLGPLELGEFKPCMVDNRELGVTTIFKRSASDESPVPATSISA